jgi:dehydrogenase/reductase SDR family protein 1
MVPRKSGLIVNVSSAAGLVYFLSVPYGIGKTACDRMASDCAHELKRHNVAMISLWPGPVKTEFSMDYVISKRVKKCPQIPGNLLFY